MQTAVQTPVASSDRKPPPPPFRYAELHTRIAELLTKGLFFIGAHPKSGTTWLQVMLNAHPEIGCAGEGHFVDRLGPRLEEALKAHNRFVSATNTSIFGEFAPFPYFEEPQFRYLLASSIALMLLAAHQDRRDLRLIGEKTPDNILHFPLLDILFPHAKFLHVVREPRDCAVSAWFHNQRTAGEAFRTRYPTFESFAGVIAGNWRRAMERGWRFAAARPNRIMVVHYEHLIQNPQATLQAVLGFLDADASPDVVRRCLADGGFEKLNGGRPPGVEAPSSFLRKGTVGDWRQHFTPALNHAFLDTAGPAMAKMGYHD